MRGKNARARAAERREAAKGRPERDREVNRREKNSLLPQVFKSTLTANQVCEK